MGDVCFAQMGPHWALVPVPLRTQSELSRNWLHHGFSAV